MDTECYPKGSASWYSCHETICWETSPRFWLLLWRTKAPYCILFMAYDMKTVTLALTAFWFLWKHCSSKSQRSCNKSVYNYRCPLPCDAGTVQQINGRGGLVRPIHQLPHSSEKTVKYWKTTFFHLIDVAIVNAQIIYNWFQLQSARKTYRKPILWCTGLQNHFKVWYRKTFSSQCQL